MINLVAFIFAVTFCLSIYINIHCLVYWLKEGGIRLYTNQILKQIRKEGKSRIADLMIDNDLSLKQVNSILNKLEKQKLIVKDLENNDLDIVYKLK